MKFAHGQKLVLVDRTRAGVLVQHMLQVVALLGPMTEIVGELEPRQVLLRMLE